MQGCGDIFAETTEALTGQWHIGRHFNQMRASHFKQVFKADGTGSEALKQCFEELLGVQAVQAQQQIFLALEIQIHRTLREPGLFGHISHTRQTGRIRHQQGLSGLEDLQTAAILIVVMHGTRFVR